MEKIKEFGHTGYGPNQGFTSLNIYYPDTKTSVIVLENQGYEDFDIAYYFESRIRQIIMQSSLMNNYDVHFYFLNINADFSQNGWHNRSFLRN